jgi:hypothetical protein
MLIQLLLWGLIIPGTKTVLEKHAVRIFHYYPEVYLTKSYKQNCVIKQWSTYLFYLLVTSC